MDVHDSIMTQFKDYLSYSKMYRMLHGNVSKTKFTNDELLVLQENEFTIKQLAELEHVTYKAMQQRIYRYRKIKGLPPKPIIKRGKIDGYWGLQIKQNIENEPLQSLRDRTNDLRKQGADFSYRTLSRYMKVQGLKTMKRERGIVFTEQHKTN